MLITGLPHLGMTVDTKAIFEELEGQRQELQKFAVDGVWQQYSDRVGSLRRTIIEFDDAGKEASS